MCTKKKRDIHQETAMITQNLFKSFLDNTSLHKWHSLNNRIERPTIIRDNNTIEYPLFIKIAYLLELPFKEMEP